MRLSKEPVSECGDVSRQGFFGGLGQTTGALTFSPEFHGILNRHPFPDVVHASLLEGMASISLRFTTEMDRWVYLRLLNQTGVNAQIFGGLTEPPIPCPQKRGRINQTAG